MATAQLVPTDPATEWMRRKSLKAWHYSPAELQSMAKRSVPKPYKMIGWSLQIHQEEGTRLAVVYADLTGGLNEQYIAL